MVAFRRIHSYVHNLWDTLCSPRTTVSCASDGHHAHNLDTTHTVLSQPDDRRCIWHCPHYDICRTANHCVVTACYTFRILYTPSSTAGSTGRHLVSMTTGLPGKQNVQFKLANLQTHCLVWDCVSKLSKLHTVGPCNIMLITFSRATHR